MVVDSTEAEVSLDELPLTYLAQFVGMAASDRVLEALRERGYADVRPSHGYVIQHLVGGPRGITELAKLLGISQQAVSKSVAELAAGCYVTDVPSDDARVRRIALTARGRDCVAATRAARAELERELCTVLGPRRHARVRDALQRLVEHLGLAEAIRLRRIRPQP